MGSGCQPIEVRCNDTKGEQRLGDRCVSLRATASINTNLVSHAMHKPSAGWTPDTASAPFAPTIQITSADRFVFGWKLADPQSMPNWLNLTQLTGHVTASNNLPATNGGGNSDKIRLPRLDFNPGGLRQMADGQIEKIALQFKGSVLSSGMLLDVNVSSVEIEMTVMSIVSLHTSSLTVLVWNNAQSKEHLWKPGEAAIEVQQKKKQKWYPFVGPDGAVLLVPPFALLGALGLAADRVVPPFGAPFRQVWTNFDFSNCPGITRMALTGTARTVSVCSCEHTR